MKCPFELPTYKDKWDVSSFCVREADGHLITAGLTEAKADYIVQAINSHEKLKKIKEISYEAICTGDQEASDKAIGLIEDYEALKEAEK